MDNGLLENVKVIPVYTGGTINNGNAETTIVDMAGYDAITWLVYTGDCINAAVAALSMVEDTDPAHGDDPTECATADKLSRTCDATNTDNVLLVYEVLRPAKRYVRLKIAESASQNFIVRSVVAILSKARDLPVSQAATAVVASKQVSSPVTE